MLGEPSAAVYSLLHFLAGCPGWALPTALLCAARTFLGANAEAPRRDRPLARFTIILAKSRE